MDPNRSPELRAVFREELEERASRLVAGARHITNDPLGEEDLIELIRHAHTIKGSAGLMGVDHIAGSAEVLERAWQAVAAGLLEPTAEVAAGLGELALLLAAAYDSAEEITPLSMVTARVLRWLAGRDEDSKGVEPGALGGLLSSGTENLLNGATRVDTADFYRLINRLVEVALDVRAVSDLTLVNLEGADPRKVLTAWRKQLERLSGSIVEVQDRAVALANVSFRDAAETFPQFVRYLGRRLEKDVRLELQGDDVQLDRQIVEQLREPLRHLLVNAVDHGLEGPDERQATGKPTTGTVSVSAHQVDDRVEIVVSDDGRGIDRRAVAAVAESKGLSLGDDPTPLLLLPDFSTRAEMDDFSGSGDGLPVVADAVERIRGGLRIESTPLRGTSVHLTLPVSLVLQNTVVVAAGDQFWGLAEAAVVASMALSDPRCQVSESGHELRFEGSTIPVISLARALGLVEAEVDQELLVVSGRAGPVGVTVPEIVDRRRVAVKNLGPILAGASHVLAAAQLGGGEVLVVLDPNFLAEFGRSRPNSIGRRPRVLVVDDSAGVRQLIGAALNGAGFDVDMAPGAREAVLRLAESAFDVLVVDYSMPRSSGVDLVRALRAADVDIPIVMVSGVATAAEQSQAWEAGVDAYMNKYDLRKGVLTTTLRRLVEERLESTA